MKSLKPVGTDYSDNYLRCSRTGILKHLLLFVKLSKFRSNSSSLMPILALLFSLSSLSLSTDSSVNWIDIYISEHVSSEERVWGGQGYGEKAP